MTPGDLLTADPRATVAEGEIVEPAEFATRQEAQLRAHRIRAHLQHAGNAYREIAEATARRDWQALGYESWEAWRDGEFGEDRLAIPRDARPQIAAIMHAAGMSTRAIGTSLGVGQRTVVRDLQSRESNDSPDKVVGRDGKEYAPSKPSRSAAANQDSPAGEGRAAGAVEEAHRPGEADGAGSPPAPSADVSAAYREDDADVRAAEFMRRFAQALERAGDVYQFDARRVADLAEDYVIESIERHAERMRQFADEIKRARSGLRVLPGGKA